MTSMSDFWEHERQGFRQREEERATVHGTVNSILSALSSAEEQLMPLSVMTSAHRYHLNRARLELVKLLRSMDEAGNTLTESNSRAVERVSERRMVPDDEPL